MGSDSSSYASSTIPSSIGDVEIVAAPALPDEEAMQRLSMFSAWRFAWLFGCVPEQISMCAELVEKRRSTEGDFPEWSCPKS